MVPEQPVRTSAHVMACFVTGFAVLFFVSGLASKSRNHTSQLLETLRMNQTFQKRHHCWRWASDCRFLVRILSRRALGVRKMGPKSSNSDSHQTTTESAIHPEAAIQPSREVAHSTSAEPERRNT